VKKIAVVAVLVMALAWCGMAFAFQNEPEGFGGLKWGDPPTEDMEFLREEDQWMNSYRNPGDKLELGDARFYMIEYEFYTPSNATVGRLMGVGLFFKDKENFEILKTICTVKFGEPTNEEFHELDWFSLDTAVLLTYGSIDEDRLLVLMSRPIFEQYTREKEKKQVEEAEEDW